MAFFLVRFVEDLIWHVCPKSDIKKIKEHNDITVMAKYGGCFYPALFINEGTKQELLALKKRYLQQDEVLKEYYKFIPNDDSSTAEKSLDAINVGIQATQINANQATQTDPELKIVLPKISSKSDETRSLTNIGTQTHDVHDKSLGIVTDSTEDDMGHEVTNTSLVTNHCEENAQAEIIVNKKININTDQAESESKQERKNGRKKPIFCMFCKTKVINFARHLQSRHQNEEKVSQFLKLPKGDAQRLAIIKEIRSLGTYIYNTDPLHKDDDIIVARRCSPNCSTKNYVPCPKCKNYYKKSLLYRHYRRCGNVSSAPRNLQALSRATVAAGTTTNYKTLQTKVLPEMLDDEVSYVAKNDKLILLYGNYLCERHEGDDHLFNMIRQKLRQLANFLITIRSIEPLVSSLESVIRPQLYDKFLEAVRKCAGYNEDDGTYRAPSLVCALGQAVKECAEKLVIECIKRQDNTLRSDVEAWLLVYKKEFSVLSRRAHTIIIRKKWNKPRLLPLTSDILILNNYLKNHFNRAFAILEKGFEASSWNELAKCTLLLILIFNRKRVGEMEKLSIIDYNRKHNIQKDSETYRNLKPSEQLFSQRYVRVEIRGKLGRAVSLMISNQEVSAIDLILKYRTLANVHHENPYVFGRGVNKYFEGARCLREAANNCNADQPALLRGTKLRKHIATVSQALNLTENELAILADYMGHNIDVHRHFYRLPSEAIHLAKVSQLLFALDTNKIEIYKGKSLDEIHFDFDVTPENEDNENSSEAFQTSDEIRSSNTAQTAAQENMEGRYESHYSSEEESWRPVNEDSDTESSSSHITPEKSKTAGRHKKCYENNSDLESWTPDRKRRKASRVSKPKRPWSTPEKYVMRSHFKEYLKDHTLPTLAECECAIKKHSVLRSRTKLQIKLWISNQIKLLNNSCVKKLFTDA